MPNEWLHQMMTDDQRKSVLRAYDHLLSKEKEKECWDGLDDCMWHLENLDDDQVHREADVIYCQHSHENARCKQEHPKEHCFIPLLVDAVGAILELYKETNNLHPKNRYILEYYLSMNQVELIIYENHQ